MKRYERCVQALKMEDANIDSGPESGEGEHCKWMENLGRRLSKTDKENIFKWSFGLKHTIYHLLQ